jgi:hypothetical protein
MAIRFILDDFAEWEGVEIKAADGVYEFLFVWPPLNFWNATGGLCSPVAIK